jgi:predicted nucleic acid-binding protein
MSAADFLDTNVLVYAYDLSSPGKQSLAKEFVRRAIAGDGVISSQVLAELSAVLLHKLSPPAPAKSVKTILDALNPIKLIAPDADLIRRAVEAHETYHVHFYDGMIIAAAERAGCARLLSEDLNNGQQYFGIPVSNPFASL